MRISLGLPTHRVDLGAEFVSAAAITELARAAEDGGFDAVYVTEHPFPDALWLDTGGHHALDPFVALSFAAAVTERIRLQTNLVVLAYRNPFLAAKSIASLDVLSGGRTIVGIGAGYLEGEFRALGVDPARRNELTDESIRAMTAAWAGEEMRYEGDGFTAAGNLMLPRPVQTPRPPLWIGGNSKRAMRRVAELADGWIPMPTTGMSESAVASRLKTASIDTTAALADRIVELRQMFADAGREGTPTVAFTPPSLLMTRGTGPVTPAQLVDEAGELAAAGVSQLTLSFPGRSRRDLLAAMEDFAADVIPQLS
ncbi:MAG TPA: LLM class F420-dependent oxidoreductase [Frankiaceae bacterium]|nr:LLM class F420-dependent oxidoreductase [Frankiaceae bacterium]